MRHQQRITFLRLKVQNKQIGPPITNFEKYKCFKSSLCHESRYFEKKLDVIGMNWWNVASMYMMCD